MGGGAPKAVLAPVDKDDGYIEPDFDLPNDDDDEVTQSFAPLAKRAKHKQQPVSIEDEEELALKLLRR